MLFHFRSSNFKFYNAICYNVNISPVYLLACLTVTPNDYQPPGFKEGDSSTLMFEKESVNLSMGEVVTPFHTLKVDVTTEKDRLEQVLLGVIKCIQMTVAIKCIF